MRAGRTRYLVVVSRPASKKAQPQHTSPQQSCNRLSASSNLNSNNFDNQAPPTESTTAENIASSHLTMNIDESGRDDNNCSISTSSQSTSGAVLHSSANMTTTCDNDSSCNLPAASSPHLCSTKTTHADVDQHCDNESTVGSSCSSKSSSNEIEESCLLGIDCNEKTTVGLVLRVLADTAIRLDGDG
jgi:protein phosphatase slingshot